jgi:predicted dehydrogenase
VRVAIVGAGMMGAWHARYAGALGAQIAAVVDARRERADALAGRFVSARAFESLAACLDAVATDVVHVCTERDQAALAEEALGAGRHVLVEKPAARSEAGARRLLAAAEQRGVRLCPVHQFVFQRGFQRLARQRQRLGTVVAVSGSVFTGGGDGLPAAERRGVLIGMTPHFVSLFRALLGPLEGVEWRTLVLSSDELELHARRGEVSLSLVASLRGRPRRNELRVVGTRASAHVDLYHGFAAFQTGGAGRVAKALAPFRHAGTVAATATANLAGRAWGGEPAFPGLRALIAAFHRCARGEGEPPIAAGELVESAALIERLERG